VTAREDSGAIARASRSGPGFLELNSRWYRLEYAAATFALLGALFIWRWRVLGGLPPTDVGLTIFWMAWPDLFAFAPIGLMSRRSQAWPSWGSRVYNVAHSLAVWGAIFAAWSLLAGGIEWPLLGWATHITADRAAGYYLRAPVARVDQPIACGNA
jgi:hypothetical protein